MNIKAKMRCWSAKKNDFGNEEVTLHAVGCDSEENKTFAKATPAAHVQMTIDNPAAQGAFIEGKDYFVTFAPASE